MVKGNINGKVQYIKVNVEFGGLHRPSCIFPMNSLNSNREQKLYSTLQDNKDINEVMWILTRLPSHGLIIEAAEEYRLLPTVPSNHLVVVQGVVVQ